MILILGGAGYAGLAVTRALAARGRGVRAFIRDPDARPIVERAGATEVVVGDLRDLRAIEDAAAGADGIFFIGPRFMPEEAALGMSVVDIAVRAGVRRFVLSGVYHPTIRELVNHQSKVTIEDHLYKTDLEFTVLQPARFMHGLMLSAWPRVVAQDVLADAFSTDAQMAYVDYNDVAEAAAIAFDEDRLVRGTFELAAPGEHTLHDLAATLSGALGRPIRAEQAPLADYGPAQTLLANPYGSDGFRRLRDYYDRYGFRGGNPLVLGTILGRAPNGFGTFLEAFLVTR
jgi:uncharacterized protein YbjT (DUF2867 family)